MSEVSVIMPVKNAGKTIKASALSILNQTHHRLKLIIVNDHSTDDSIDLVEEIDDPRVQILHNPGEGIGSALNHGINATESEFIARMDADDISHPNRIETQLTFAKKNPRLKVISCLVNYRGIQDNNSNTGEGYKHYVRWTNQILTASDHFNNRFSDAPLAHPTILCKKAIFEQYGYYREENIPEDFELWLRWMAQGVSFGKCPSKLFDYYDYPYRLSRNSQNYSSEKFFDIKAKYLSKLINNQPRKRLWVWGYGKNVFRRSDFLVNYKLAISGYVDFKERPKSQRHVISISKVKKTDHDIYLVYLSDRRGKEKIANFFKEQDMLAGKHYWFMS